MVNYRAILNFEPSVPTNPLSAMGSKNDDIVWDASTEFAVLENS